jgi:hypothetical protein
MPPRCVILSILGMALAISAHGAELRERWIYCASNLAVDKNIEALESIAVRGAKAGYNGIVLSDSKFGRLGELNKHYFQNIARVKKIAATNQLQIIPCIFPMGYSESLLAHDPNLAEGLPVRAALYVVENGQARLVADPAVKLPRDGFKNLAQWQFHDETVVADNNGAVTITDPKGKNARVAQKVNVHPFRQYHISVRVKTQDFEGTPRVAVLGKAEHELNYAGLGTKKTQDWTTHEVVFNSLDNDQLEIYFGCWDGKTGTLEWKDPKLEETGLINLIRRDGAPLEIKEENGTALVEGTDFNRVVDPRMGAVPWPGSFEVWHEPPVIHTRLADGTRLRVSYYHATIIHDDQVMICPSEPKTMALLRDQAKRMVAAWGAKSYFMSHDEIRVLNWDKSCQNQHATAGGILAENVRACISLLREVNPGGDIYVWSDMFDPNHNAHKDYYLVNGDLAGSWRGLDHDVIIVPWDFDERTDALKWFESLGNRMLIAGYYDTDPNNVKEWLNAARPVKGVIGLMYTTWENRYDDLERFGKLLNTQTSQP